MATTNNSRLNTEKKATPGCVSTVEILLQDILSKEKQGYYLSFSLGLFSIKLTRTACSTKYLQKLRVRLCTCKDDLGTPASFYVSDRSKTIRLLGLLCFMFWCCVLCCLHLMNVFIF